MKKLKRGLALLLVALMLITTLPISAMAAEDPGPVVISTETISGVDLTGCLEEELRNFPLEKLLPDVDLSDVTELAWDTSATDTTNNFTVVSTADGTIDLSKLIYANSYYGDTIPYSLEILKSDQLDRTTRYIVPVEVPNLAQVLQLDACQADGASIGSFNIYRASGNSIDYRLNPDIPIWDVWEAVVSMKLNSDMTNLADLTARVYEGYYSDVYDADVSGMEITDDIWEKDTEGYCADWTYKSEYPKFTVVLERGGEPVQVLHITAGMGSRGVNFGLDVYTPDADAEEINAYIGLGTYFDMPCYYIDPADYNTWQSGEATLKLRYGNADDVTGIDCSDYEDQTDVTVYTGYYEDEDALYAAISSGEALDITRYIWGDSSKGYTEDYTDRDYPIAFTVVVQHKDTYATAYMVPFYVRMYAQYIPPEQPVRVTVDNYLYRTSSGNTRVSERYQVRSDDSGSYYFTMLWPTDNTNNNQPYSAYNDYYVGFSISGGADGEDPLDAIASIMDSSNTDIKATLFPSGGQTYYNVRYQVTFSETNQPITFTVNYTDPEVEPQVFSLRTVPARPPQNTSSGSTDTYFNVYSVTIGGTTYTPYSVPYYIDNSYSDGFRVLFVDVAKEDLEAGEVTINFHTGTGVRMYRDLNEQGQFINSNSSETLKNVKSGVPELFSAASESGTHLRNYWITLIAKDSGGPQLWVNGQNDGYHIDEETGLTAREMYMSGSGYYDILFANVGDEPLEDLEVTLSGSASIRLDDYWTIGETRTLAAYTNTTPSTALGNYQQLENMAKIRIWADKAGDIDAILTISASGQAPVSIKLTGKVGTSIISSSVPNGVKYVPYYSLIQTNYSGNTSNRPTFKIESGVLPDNLEIKPNGEIYGVPQVWSDNPFTFTVGMYQEGQLVDTKTFTMTISENTDENVWNASDITYEVEEEIGKGSRAPESDSGNNNTAGNDGSYHYVIDLAQANLEKDEDLRTLVSKGPYIYYAKVWLDGKELTAYVDYTPSEGSTKIVLHEETIGNTNGDHTLAIEFREGGTDGTLKRTAQNYTIEGGINPTTPQQPSGGSTGGSSTGGGSTGGGTGGGNTGGGQTPSKTFPFVDVKSNDWEYGDVYYVWDKGLMTGITPTTFEPDTYVSQAMIVVTLARLGGVDLTAYENDSVDGAAPGAWYTPAAAWAQRTGILPDNTSFNGESGSYSRDNMAIMLVKYLARMGVDTTVGGSINFDDMDQMSADGRDAFRVLCHYGIFKGVGDNKMNPGGVTTRAEFAALLHRVSDFVTGR